MALGAARARAIVAPSSHAVALPGLVAVLGAGVLMQGAFYDAQLALTLIVAALAALAAAALAVPRALAAGAGILGAGLVASALATGLPPEAFKPAATLALAITCCALAARAAARDGVEAVLDGVVLVAAAAAALGLLGVALHLEEWALRADTWRLTSTLSYQNAAGALLAVALAPALVRARRSPARGVALVLIAAGLAATLSRGAIVAGLVGIVVLWAGARDTLRIAAPLVPAVVVAVASMIPAITGARAGWLAAATGSAIAIAFVLRPPSRTLRRALVAALVAVLLVAWALTPLRDRFTLSTTDRARVWTATVERLGDHPMFGTGPGTYVLFAPAGGRIVRTAHAHNEYLQVAAETGLVGIAAVFGAIGTFAWAALRARPRYGRARGVWAAGIASGAALLVHAGTDFVWRMPAIVAMAFVVFTCALINPGWEEP